VRSRGGRRAEHRAADESRTPGKRTDSSLLANHSYVKVAVIAREREAVRSYSR